MKQVASIPDLDACLIPKLLGKNFAISLGYLPRGQGLKLWVSCIPRVLLALVIYLQIL